MQQVGPPNEIYEAPANPFIADFIGESTSSRASSKPAAATRCGCGSSRGRVIEVAGRADLAAHPGQKVRVMVRPERFVDLAAEPNSRHANRIDGRVTDSAYIGVSDKYRVVTAGWPRRPDAAAIGAEQPALQRRRADRGGFPCRRRAADCRAMTPGYRPSARRSQAASRLRPGPFALTLPALLLLTLLFMLPLAAAVLAEFRRRRLWLVREGADRRALHRDPLPHFRDRRHRHASSAS